MGRSARASMTGRDLVDEFGLCNLAMENINHLGVVLIPHLAWLTVCKSSYSSLTPGALAPSPFYVPLDPFLNSPLL